MTHRALAQPPRSWLRKMSANTMISNQIQMKNMKNQSIDQSSWPTPHSAKTNMDHSFSHGDGAISVAGRREVITRTG